MRDGDALVCSKLGSGGEVADSMPGLRNLLHTLSLHCSATLGQLEQSVCFQLSQQEVTLSQHASQQSTQRAVSTLCWWGRKQGQLHNSADAYRKSS